MRTGFDERHDSQSHRARASETLLGRERKLDLESRLVDDSGPAVMFVRYRRHRQDEPARRSNGASKSRQPA
jgi:hypothetical protein